MEQKKSQKAKLEQNIPVYFAMGLILALSVLLTAFEWSSANRRSSVNNLFSPVNEVEEIQMTVREPKPPKPAIEPPKVISPDELIVTDKEIEQMDIISTEVTTDNINPEVMNVPKRPEPVREEEEALIVAEVMPSFKGGTAALMQFLNETVKYPQAAIEQQEAGRVICTFVVELDGSIANIEVLRGVSPALDKEAIRVIQSMPAWNPGFQNGKTVRVKFTLPITFRLSNR